LFYTDFNYLNY